jgi:hypothetical protein
MCCALSRAMDQRLQHFTHQRDQKVVNFEQISIRKWAHAPLDRGDVFLEVWRQFDLNIHGDRS